MFANNALGGKYSRVRSAYFPMLAHGCINKVGNVAAESGACLYSNLGYNLSVARYVRFCFAFHLSRKREKPSRVNISRLEKHFAAGNSPGTTAERFFQLWMQLRREIVNLLARSRRVFPARSDVIRSDRMFFRWTRFEVSGIHGLGFSRFFRCFAFNSPLSARGDQRNHRVLEQFSPRHVDRFFSIIHRAENAISSTAKNSSFSRNNRGRKRHFSSKSVERYPYTRRDHGVGYANLCYARLRFGC